MAEQTLWFEGLLQTLQDHHFALGVDHFIRLEALFKRIGYSCNLFELRNLLCPILATSADEQERFQALFDAYFPALIEQAKTVTPIKRRSSSHNEQIPEPASPRRRALPALAVLGVAAVLWFSGDFRPKPVKPEPICDSTRAAPGCPAPQPPDTTKVKPPEPLNDSIVDVVLSTTQPETTWLQRHQATVRGTLAVLPLFLLGIAELIRRIGRRRKRPESGPFYQPMHVPSAGRWYRSDEFYRTARALRQRQLGESQYLSVEDTLDATIDSMGYPAFRYRRRTRPPEYLVLIDRSGVRDHQARLFESLAEALRREGLILERFFFDADPRLLYRDSLKQPESLAQLERRSRGARLVLFSDGERFLDPEKGTLLSWTSMFESWGTRALLTPTPMASWSGPEDRLAERFLVLPATMKGLSAMVDQFARGSDTGVVLPSREASETSTARHPELDLGRLKASLGSDVYRWLSACAVYPQLQWDLTIYLGSLPAVGHGLVTEANLLRLARLPWFRQGVIPEPVRAHLLKSLKPATEAAVRQALLSLLNGSPPPVGSTARRNHDVEVLVQRLGLVRVTEPGVAGPVTPSEVRLAPRDALLQELEIAGLGDALPVPPVLGVLPKRWWPALFENGHPGFGALPGPRALACGALGLLLWFAIPKQPIPPGRLQFSPDQGTIQVGKGGIRVVRQDRLEPDSTGAAQTTFTVDDTTIAILDSSLTVRARSLGTARLLARRGQDSAVVTVGVVRTAVEASLLATLTAMIHFDFDETSVRADDRALLDHKAAILRANKAVRMRLAGHNDENGSDTYALAVGQRRAVSAATYLVNQGVDAGRLETISYGKERPIDTAHTEDAYARNRRVDFEVIAGGETLVPPDSTTTPPRSSSVVLTGYRAADTRRFLASRPPTLHVGDSALAKLAGLSREFASWSVSPRGILVLRELPVIDSSITDSLLARMMDGRISAVAPGTATLTVTRGSERATITIRVIDSAGTVTDVAPIEAFPADTTLPVGDTMRVRVSSSRIPPVFSVKDPNIASVTRDGRVQALAPGVTTVVVQNQSGYAYLVIRVTEAIPQFRIQPSSVLIYVGDVTRLNLDQYGKADAYQQATPAGPSWASNDLSVATVDQGGTVRGVSPGKATVVARLGSNTASANVTVMRAPYTSETEGLRRRLRATHGVTIIDPDQSRDHGDIGTERPGINIYGWVDRKYMASLSLKNPVTVTASYSPGDLEVHRVNDVLLLIGFITEEESRTLTKKGLVRRTNLATEATRSQNCLVSVPLNQIGDLAVLADSGQGVREIQIGSNGPSLGIVASELCVSQAMAK